MLLQNWFVIIIISQFLYKMCLQGIMVVLLIETNETIFRAENAVDMLKFLQLF